jgi:1,5-anhydro-D-fructose reductase (1,5-anhydro-D-mannitol-forming)
MALGWAIVSTGRHADTLVAPAIGLATETHLIAVYSREQARADAFAAKHGAQVAYASLEALLEDSRVDVVFIASPNFLHAPYTQMAAQRGKHVLVEKPMAVHGDEAIAMVRTCHAHGVKLGVGFHLRHHPGYQEARRLIGEGVLGSMTLVQAQWEFGRRGQAEIPLEVFMEARSGQRSAWWRQPEHVGGAWALMAMGVHCVDLLSFLLRQDVVEVATLSDGQRPDSPLERLATVCVRFHSGALGTVCCGSRIPDSKNDATLYGSHGRIALENALGTALQGALDVVSDTVQTTVAYPTEPLALYTRQVEAFNTAIQYDEEPAASGLDGLRAVQATGAIIESAATGRAVKIAPLSAVL